MTAIEWVPGQWNDIRRGFRVRITDSYGSIEGVADHVNYNETPAPPSVLIAFSQSSTVRVYRNDTTQVFVEAPTKPELPTEPGMYSEPEPDQTSQGGYHTDGLRFFYLNANSNWVDVGWGDPLSVDGPFTRLEPVAETAKKVLDAIDNLWEPGQQRYLTYGHTAKIAADFGVTS
jgi:hypothetical protein